jgi:hypothetical protein
MWPRLSELHSFIVMLPFRLKSLDSPVLVEHRSLLQRRRLRADFNFNPSDSPSRSV